MTPYRLQGDISSALQEAMLTISQFWIYLGLTINWSKSALMLLDEAKQPVAQSYPISPTTFKYLGNQITLSLTDFCHLNITPLPTCFCCFWLSLIGKRNVIKMILMPPTLIFSTKYTRSGLSISFSELYCGTLRLEQLQHPKDDGGVALPNPWLYYLATQLQHVASDLPQTCDTLTHQNPIPQLEFYYQPLKEQMDMQTAKLDEMKNRSRRNNLRVIGLPERSEGPTP